MNNYLIIFNTTQNFDQTQIHEFIVSINGIEEWWHYLPNTYIVGTNKTSKQIADSIIQKFQGLLFLIIKIDINDYNGVLNKDAWTWLGNKNKQTVKIKPISNNLKPYLKPSSSSSYSDALIRALAMHYRAKK